MRDVFYESFGAIGDGVSDDSNAVTATHVYANEYGHRVVAKVSAKYLIASLQSAIEIKTDTVWHGATFIIDDRDISYDSPKAKTEIFKINSDNQMLEFDESSETLNKIFESGSLSAGTGKINIELGYSAILIIENDGTAQREVILVDADGNVDPSTPLTQNFDSASRIYVK